jgi:hypothetical protein
MPPVLFTVDSPVANKSFPLEVEGMHLLAVSRVMLPLVEPEPLRASTEPPTVLEDLPAVAEMKPPIAFVSSSAPPACIMRSIAAPVELASPVEKHIVPESALTAAPLATRILPDAHVGPSVSTPKLPDD